MNHTTTDTMNAARFHTKGGAIDRAFLANRDLAHVCAPGRKWQVMSARFNTFAVATLNAAGELVFIEQAASFKVKA